MLACRFDQPLERDATLPNVFYISFPSRSLPSKSLSLVPLFVSVFTALEVFSAGAERLAVLAYVPEEKQAELVCEVRQRFHVLSRFAGVMFAVFILWGCGSWKIVLKDFG